MTTLSKADKTNLSSDQQNQISQLKQDWSKANAAGDTAGMQAAHDAAESIRATAGYSGGNDGSGWTILPAGSGGRTVEDVRNGINEFKYYNQDPDAGWINGYSTAANHRSMANDIRQQMKANSDAWAAADEAGKAYLHEQNVQLAQLLSDVAGGVQSTYNEALGRWETDDANLGYGYYTGAYRDEQWAKDHYGMTDEQIESYRNDTNRYYNFVDQDIVRNWYDESSGYTGKYAQFVNGPYGQLLLGTNNVNRATYTDVIGDGFGKEGDSVLTPVRDDQGNIVPQEPLLKNNNTMNDYTRRRAAYVENGVIQTGRLQETHPGGYGVEERSSHGQRLYSPEEETATGSLEQWQQSAMAQAAASRDYAVDKAVQQLLQAQADAEAQYQTQRDQIAKEELNALDNSALYAETRGDRGGIGRSQYDHIQAQAEANRQSVSNAQVQLATDTAQQIAQLRAQGEFEKADEMMEISQTYLLKLLEMEKWAAQYQLDVDKFQESIRQWEQEFQLTLAKALI